jgi:hypothetical protein
MRTTPTAIVVLSLWMVATATRMSGQPQPAASALRPLDVRVTMDYRGRSASEVLQTLTRAAGLTVTIAAGSLLPVTIALTNARLETALNAVCENASCRWTLQNQSVFVTPEPIDVASALPQEVSIALSDASVLEVFRALAASLNVQLTVEGTLPDGPPVNIKFTNAPPANVLSFLAQVVNCSWQFEDGRLVVRRLP